jgi:hypothetical protein
MERAQDWYAMEAPRTGRPIRRRTGSCHRADPGPALAVRGATSGGATFSLNVFPHEVWYLVHEELQRVELVALVHDRQDPSLLATRLT